MIEMIQEKGMDHRQEFWGYHPRLLQTGRPTRTRVMSDMDDLLSSSPTTQAEMIC